MVTLHTIDGGTVNAINDALLYDFIIGQNGIATGATVTSEGALLLHIDSGWGVIKGRIFSIEAETVSATPSTSGTVKGRLILQIDITNTTDPITFVTQAAATLPALQQEDINNNGTIYQLPIATYDVNEVAVSNLQMVAPVVKAIKGRIDSARSAANAAQSTANQALNGNFKNYVFNFDNDVTISFSGYGWTRCVLGLVLVSGQSGCTEPISISITGDGNEHTYTTESIFVSNNTYGIEGRTNSQLFIPANIGSRYGNIRVIIFEQNVTCSVL